MNSQPKSIHTQQQLQQPYAPFQPCSRVQGTFELHPATNQLDPSNETNQIPNTQFQATQSKLLHELHLKPLPTSSRVTSSISPQHSIINTHRLLRNFIPHNPRNSNPEIKQSSPLQDQRTNPTSPQVP
ncbi:hypothetical protein Droror1_Dr00023630 [Drosera rotundifolia]